MVKPLSSLLAPVIGASAALTGLILKTSCSGGCAACLRCAGIGAGIAIAAICCRLPKTRDSYSFNSSSLPRNSDHESDA